MDINGKPPKVAILVNSLRGAGAERVAVTLHRIYLKLGVDVVFVCLEEGFGFTLTVGQPIVLQSHSWLEPVLGKFLSLFILARRLKRLVRKQQITLVQSHLYRANFVNVLASLMGSGHLSQIVNHGMPARYRSAGLKGRLNLALIRWLYPRSVQLVCPCSEMLRDFQSFGLVHGDAKIIANPFDRLSIHNLLNVAPTEGDFEFAEGTKYLVVVGRLEPIKRVGDIICALSEVRKRHPQTELLVLGNGPEQAVLEALALRLDLGNDVHFMGHVNNPYYFMAKADLLIAASESEGFGNVLVEAAICNTPVLSARCPGGPVAIVESLYGDNSTAHLFAVGDTDEMVTKICGVLGGICTFDDVKKTEFMERIDATNVAQDYLSILERR